MVTMANIFPPVLLLILTALMVGCDRTPQGNFQLGDQAEQVGNYAEAYWYWRPLADAGEARAQNRLAWLYANGLGLVMDTQKAAQWWRRAAEQGHADAAFTLADLYRKGEGLKADPALAVHWLKRALELGVADAGPMLLAMAGIGVDAAEALVRERLRKQAWRQWGAVRRVNSERANLRAGMGTEFAQVGSLGKGEEVLLLHQENNWARIGLPGSGKLAWIYLPLIDVVE